MPTVFFGTVFFLVLAYGLWRWNLISKIKKWKRVRATLQKRESTRILGSMKGMPYVRYDPKIEFSYQVAGATYTGTRFSIHNFTLGIAGNEIDELLNGAAEGQTIEVYFDPRNPQNSILAIPGYEGVVIALTVGATGLALVVALHFLG